MSDPVKGRLDVLLARLVEEGCKRAQAATGFDFWNGLPEHGQSGMKQVTEDLIDQCGIPRVPVDIPRTLAAGLASLAGAGRRTPQLQRKRREYGSQSNRRAKRRVARSV